MEVPGPAAARPGGAPVAAHPPRVTASGRQDSVTATPGCGCAPPGAGADAGHEPACPRYWDHLDGAAAVVTACRYAQAVASYDQDRAGRGGDPPGRLWPAEGMAVGIAARAAELELETP
jgi:hypothetical protein